MKMFQHLVHCFEWMFDVPIWWRNVTTSLSSPLP